MRKMFLWCSILASVLAGMPLMLRAADPAVPELAPADQAVPIPGITDRQSRELLGETYESPAAGIAFRAPAGAERAKRPSADHIVEYVNEKQSWVLRVRRVTLAQPMPLATVQEASGRERPGMLEITADQILQAQRGATVFRKDQINIGKYDVGVLALRFTLGTDRWLRQEAVVQENERVYYVFSLTTPSRSEPQQDDPATTDVDESLALGPEEELAARTFEQMLDTVRILDRSAIKADQDQRLYRTRSLFVNWTEQRLRQAVVPQQYLRLVQNGKDIGYSVIFEQVVDRGPHQGIEIRSYTYSEPAAEQVAEIQSDTFISLDRRHESWTTLHRVLDKGVEKELITEVGISDRRMARVLDETAAAGDAKDPKQPPVRIAEDYNLEVKYMTKTGNSEPINRRLPPFYLPQALGQMLPRLLPLNEAKTFMFASYASQEQEVASRYVDVGWERPVTLAGRNIRAVPVTDKFGLEGPPTHHFVSSDGKYLGSEITETGVTVLPTTEADLRQRWPKVKLFAPRQGKP